MPFSQRFRAHRLGDGKIAVEVVGETAGTILQLTAAEFAEAIGAAAKRPTKKRTADLKRLIEEE